MRLITFKAIILGLVIIFAQPADVRATDRVIASSENFEALADKDFQCGTEPSIKVTATTKIDPEASDMKYAGEIVWLIKTAGKSINFECPALKELEFAIYGQDKITFVTMDLKTISVISRRRVKRHPQNENATPKDRNTQHADGQKKAIKRAMRNKKISKQCYKKANVGKVGKPEWSGCDDMLIVDNVMLRNFESKEVDGLEFYALVKNGRNFTFSLSDNNIFTGQVTDMSRLFSHSNFNGDISYWDVSNVTDMQGMFGGANTFNQPLAYWDVSNVRNMKTMFANARAFNQPLADWDVSNVRNMESMFSNARAFNQPLADWDVSNVRNMESMFMWDTSFNQPLADWDVSNVRNMESMFNNARAFNQPLADWDVSHVTNMDSLFLGAGAFNQPLSGWDVSNVQNMRRMFVNAMAFNQPLTGWDVRYVRNCNDFAPHAKIPESRFPNCYPN